MGARHHFRVKVERTQFLVINASDAVVGPGGNREACLVLQHEADEIHMGLARVETGVNMGEGNWNEAGGIHDRGSLHHQLHGELVGLALDSGEEFPLMVVKGEAHALSKHCQRYYQDIFVIPAKSGTRTRVIK